MGGRADRGGPLSDWGVVTAPSTFTVTSVNVEGSKAQQMLKMIEALEDQEDIQNVWANFDVSDEVLESA